MPTEKEILVRLAEAEKEYEHSKKSLAKAKKLLVAAETETINHKLHLDRIKEELRVHRATIPSTHPEITLREQEIIRFREDHPELVDFAKERDQNKP